MNIYQLEPKEYTLQSASGANGNGTVADLDGRYGSLTLQVVGATWTGTLNFEASQDGTNYIAIEGVNKNSGAKITTTTGDVLVVFDVTGVRKFRARQSGFAAGTVTATATATALPPNAAQSDTGVTIDSALPAGDNNIGNVDLASAIPAGTNNIGDVDIASALPAGTNNIGDVDVASIAAGANIIGKVGIDQTTPGTTNGVQVNAALPAGTNNIGDVDIASALPAGANIVGKVGIDQTTPGTTNGVQVVAALPAGANNIGDVDVLTLPAGTVAGSSSLPAGTNNIGDVDVASIAAGANIIGKVGIDQTTPGTTNGVQVNAALPAGDNNIGNVDLASAIPAGTNNIGDVDVLSVNGYAGAFTGATGSAVPAGAVQVGASDGTNLNALLSTAGASDPSRALSVHNTLVVSSSLARSYAQSDVADGSTGTTFAPSGPMLSNGTTYDHQRGNTEGTLLASAARTTTTTTATQTNYNASGLMLFLKSTAITDTPSIVVNVQAVDPVSGDVRNIAAFTAVTSIDTQLYCIYPGAVETTAVAQFEVQGCPVPRSWKVVVTHADADSITYSLGYQYIL